MREKYKMTADKTGVITSHPVTDMYNVNVDYTERTVLDLVTQEEPTVEIQDIISKAIADFEADS